MNHHVRLHQGNRNCLSNNHFDSIPNNEKKIHMILANNNANDWPRIKNSTSMGIFIADTQNIHISHVMCRYGYSCYRHRESSRPSRISVTFRYVYTDVYTYVGVEREPTGVWAPQRECPRTRCHFGDDTKRWWMSDPGTLVVTCHDLDTSGVILGLRLVILLRVPDKEKKRKSEYLLHYLQFSSILIHASCLETINDPIMFLLETIFQLIGGLSLRND